MDAREVLEKLVSGEIDIDQAERLLRLDYVERIGNHTVFDMGRECRSGIPEVVYASGKEPEKVGEIVERVVNKKDIIVVSRASAEYYDEVVRRIGGEGVAFKPEARMIIVDRRGCSGESLGKIGILTAGTSDIPVAEEAAAIAEVMGCSVIKGYDVGIAGIHRLLEPLKKMIKEDVACVVVVAGMEGALPSVVAGMVGVPVIGVPTSIGYGLGAGGIGALTTMLQSCVPGLVVVNIDNGFNAGATAALIAKMRRTR
ncbi:NCAIR mutase (PurE)-related protein [Methanocella conradii HZ254]|uniref:NCAIR mutase (PurE)-related protein n=1 Tax=Methanocella conradii (strain DSM 24694 / JCM 17849 / CGMCC 1.5162 / HZ254) TaxID=1041930 RepID=H8IAG2_METCZ|nr:nickel pincer cofactor biosynthesis protein LarB [Methanocella conradii]AFC99636.1 NCAIR mutase (PurE)-related protein [Methanocella conradii HZ254]